MSEYGFFLTHNFPCKGKITILRSRENAGYSEPAFWPVLHSEVLQSTGNI